MTYVRTRGNWSTTSGPEVLDQEKLVQNKSAQTTDVEGENSLKHYYTGRLSRKEHRNAGTRNSRPLQQHRQEPRISSKCNGQPHQDLQFNQLGLSGPRKGVINGVYPRTFGSPWRKSVKE